MVHNTVQWTEYRVLAFYTLFDCAHNDYVIEFSVLMKSDVN